MNKFFSILLSACPMLLGFSGISAQVKVSYIGPRIDLSQHSLTSRCLGPLHKEDKKSLQGMAIWKNTLISLQDYGYANVYDFDGCHLKYKGSMKLGSYGEANHANVASFGNQYYREEDKLPLLYVTQCKRWGRKGLNKLLFVERINPDSLRSELMQRIWFNDLKSRYEGNTQYVVDRETNMLYLFGNSKVGLPEDNRHPIFKFRLPEYRGPQDSLVVLTEDEALDSFYVEDIHQEARQHVGQGAYARNGIIYFPVGVGDEKRPSLLFVLDANRHQMRNVIDLTKVTKSELEDCDVYDGDLIVQSQRAGLWRLHFE